MIWCDRAHLRGLSVASLFLNRQTWLFSILAPKLIGLAIILLAVAYTEK